MPRSRVLGDGAASSDSTSLPGSGSRAGEAVSEASPDGSPTKLAGSGARTAARPAARSAARESEGEAGSASSSAFERARVDGSEAAARSRDARRVGLAAGTSVSQ